MDDDAGRLDRSSELRRVGQALRELAAQLEQPVAGRPPRSRPRAGRHAAGRPGTPARPPAAAGWSSLLNATIIGFSRSAGSCASSSSRMTPWAHSGSRAEPSTTWTRTRVRSTWRRKAWPRPAPWLAPSMRPGHVGDRRAPLVVLAEVEHPEVRLERRERVVGDLRVGRRQRGEQGRLAGVRQADEPDVGDQPELEAEPALLARLALLGVLRGPVGRASRSGRCRGRPGRRARPSRAARSTRGRRRARRSRRRRRPCPAGRPARGRRRPCRGASSPCRGRPTRP